MFDCSNKQCCVSAPRGTRRLGGSCHQDQFSMREVLRCAEKSKDRERKHCFILWWTGLIWCGPERGGGEEEEEEEKRDNFTKGRSTHTKLWAGIRPGLINFRTFSYEVDQTRMDMDPPCTTCTSQPCGHASTPQSILVVVAAVFALNKIF